MCTICNKDLEGNINITLTCGHTFHKKCIEFKSTCPECSKRTGFVPVFKSQDELDKYYDEKHGMSICKAAEKGKIDALADMVENGATICPCAVAKAVFFGHINVVKYLLDHNAPTDEQALMAATVGNDIEMVKYLLERGVEKSSKALNFAVVENFTDIAKLLISKGIISDTALNIALIEKNKEIAKILIQEGKTIEEEYVTKDVWEFYKEVKHQLKNSQKNSKKKNKKIIKDQKLKEDIYKIISEDPEPDPDKIENEIIVYNSQKRN